MGTMDTDTMGIMSTKGTLGTLGNPGHLGHHRTLTNTHGHQNYVSICIKYRATTVVMPAPVQFVCNAKFPVGLAWLAYGTTCPYYHSCVLILKAKFQMKGEYNPSLKKKKKKKKNKGKMKGGRLEK